ncbi:MAG: hypothetical protein WCC48_01305 [Anaeromyxobacteraceae bacterium]
MTQQRDVGWRDLLRPIRISNGIVSVRVRREVIPIIFLPGLMGSRLQLNPKWQGKRPQLPRANPNGILWDPDNGGWMFQTYGRDLMLPWRRKEFLVGEAFSPRRAIPADHDDAHNQKFLSGHEGAVERGWGGVMFTTYGRILTTLHASQTWIRSVGEYRLSDFFRLPCYAFAYNWMDDVGNTGAKLREYAKALVERHDTADEECKQVILVTHSMGGLVARAACFLGPAGEAAAMRERVLGVVHGVQPSTGAAAAFWRMKAGFERDGFAWTSVLHSLLEIAGTWVLGKDGPSVTALLAHMPGAMTLLPGFEYTDNDGARAWLQVIDETGEGRSISLPKADPHAEIYRKDSGLLRLVNPEHLDPGAPRTPWGAVAAPDWTGFTRNLNMVEAAQRGLTKNQHPETHTFWGFDSSRPTCDRVVLRRRLVRMPEPLQVSPPLPRRALEGHHSTGATIARQPEPPEGTPISELSGNRYIARVRERGKLYEYTMDGPAGDGDGTVPVSSGSSLSARGDSHRYEVSRSEIRSTLDGHHGPAPKYGAAASGGGGQDYGAIRGVVHQDAFQQYDEVERFTVDAVARLCLMKIDKAR